MRLQENGVVQFSNAPNKGEFKLVLKGSRVVDPPQESAQPAPAPAADFRSEFVGMVEEISSRHGVDAPLVYAIIEAESNFNPEARSPRGARGLMQLMPATAQQHGVGDVYDPRQNIEGGVRHIRLLLDRYGGDLLLALAAYNAGPGRVERYGDIPPYRETIDYLTRVVDNYEHYSRVSSFQSRLTNQ